MRAFVVRHWDALREADASTPRARRVFLDRACEQVRRAASSPEWSEVPAVDDEPWVGATLMPLLEAQAPSLPPLEVHDSRWQAVFDVEFLLTVCDDLMVLLEQARATRESELLADLATGGEVLESLPAGLSGIAQIANYARDLAELRGAAEATRAGLLRELQDEPFLRDGGGPSEV